jgi:hypothetical protein
MFVLVRLRPAPCDAVTRLGSHIMRSGGFFCPESTLKYPNRFHGLLYLPILYFPALPGNFDDRDFFQMVARPGGNCTHIADASDVHRACPIGAQTAQSGCGTE